MPAGPSQELSATSYAVLGLFSLREEMSGYELKQLADRTLKFFWTSPAMSHVYSELRRLHQAGLVEERVAKSGRKLRRRYRLSKEGGRALRGWLGQGEVGFPALKHEVVLRLFLGGLSGPERPLELLGRYRAELHARIAELVEIRSGLGDDPQFHYAATVAEWGIRYYQEELVSAAAAESRLS